MKSKPVRILLYVACFVLGLGKASIAPKAGPPKPEQFEATIKPAFANWDSLSIAIDGYSTNQEMQDLAQVYSRKGRAALEDALQKVTKGSLRVGPSATATTPIFIVLSAPTEGGGRRIQIVAFEPSRFSPLDSSHSVETPYPYCILELDLDARGNGKGKLTPSADLEFEQQGHIKLRRYGHRTFELLSVHSKD